MTARIFNFITKMLLSFVLAGLFVYPVSGSKALTEEFMITDTITYYSSFTLETDVMDFIPDFVDVPEGGIAWEIFGETESVEYQDKDEDGRDFYGVRPEFGEDLKKLDGQTILMQGYMFPLQAEEGQELFLFGPFPVTCPYHYHTGPSLVIEANAKEKIEFRWDAIDVRGRLELVPRDDEFNIFYRLHDVVLVR